MADETVQISCPDEKSDRIVEKTADEPCTSDIEGAYEEEHFEDAVDHLNLGPGFNTFTASVGKDDHHHNDTVADSQPLDAGVSEQEGQEGDEEETSSESDVNSFTRETPSNECGDDLGEALAAEVLAEATGSQEDDESEKVAHSELVIDEAVLREREASLTDEEKQLRQQESRRLKDIGNSQFAEGCYEAAIVTYTDALASCLLCHNIDRAIIYANRAAAKMRLGQDEAAIADCTKALEFNGDYMKALLRRAELYEKTDKFDEALEDYTKAVERDPSLHIARQACMRLPDKIKERNEKMKDEMLSKLKDLGNMILRPFGLSTNNFKLQQDPSTGSYSVNFQQGAPAPQGDG